MQLHQNGVKNWRCILWRSGLGNLVLHRLGEPVMRWHHLIPRHANVHVIVVILRGRFRRSSQRDRLWTAAAALGSGRGYDHGRLSPPYPAGFGGSPAACDLARHRQNTCFCRTDGSALPSHQQPWHSRMSRARPQHFPSAWSPQQPPT